MEISAVFTPLMLPSKEILEVYEWAFLEFPGDFFPCKSFESQF